MPAAVAPADDGDNSDGRPSTPADGDTGETPPLAIAADSEFDDEFDGEEDKALIKPRKMKTKQICLELGVRLHEAMDADTSERIYDLCDAVASRTMRWERFSRKHKLAMAKHGGAFTMIALLDDDKWAEDPIMANTVMRAILPTMASDAQLSQKIVENGGRDVVMKTMANFADDQDLQKRGNELIQSMLGHSVEIAFRQLETIRQTLVFCGHCRPWFQEKGLLLKREAEEAAEEVPIVPDDAGLVIPGMVDDVALITGGSSGGEKGYGRNRPHHSHPGHDTYEGDFVQGAFG